MTQNNMMYKNLKNISQKLAMWSAVLVLSVGSSLAASFLSVAPDIPLAPGLSEAETGALIFDKPEGRIVSIEALAATPSAVGSTLTGCLSMGSQVKSSVCSIINLQASL